MTPRPPHNPFATRWVRPGSLAYRFADATDAEQLVEQLRANRWQGEIIGPHGAGKSTLLETLIPVLQAAGRDVQQVTLHDGQRRLPPDSLPPQHGTPHTQWVIDGYEQLGPLARWLLCRRVRRAGSGLLVTAHRPMGLPPLYDVQPSEATFAELVAQLQAGQPTLVAPADAAASFARRQGDIREALFELYDLYEQRNRAPR